MTKETILKEVIDYVSRFTNGQFHKDIQFKAIKEGMVIIYRPLINRLGQVPLNEFYNLYVKKEGIAHDNN